jgi:hypothetical protein
MQRKYSYIIKEKKNLSFPEDEIFNTSSLFDLEEQRSIYSSKTKEELDISKYFKANFICKCSHHFKNNELSKIFFLNDSLDLFTFNKKNDIKCPKCNSKLDVVNSIKLENPYSATNVFTKKYSFFKDDDRIKIVLFTTKIQYNKKGKVFIQKDRKSIIFNAKEKTFFYYGTYNNSKNKRIIGVSNQNFVRIFSYFFSSISDWKQKVCYNTFNVQNIFRNYHSDILEPLKNFMYNLIQHLNNKDVERILTYINLKNIDFYLNEELKKNQYIEDLSLISSIIQYSYNSNILFNKGKDFYLSMLQEQSLPNNSYLKTKKPTSPSDILKESFKYETLKQLYFCKRNLKIIIKRDYPNLILNNSNIKKLKHWKDNKQEFSKIKYPTHLDWILNIERLKNDLNKNANNLFLPKIALKQISNWKELHFLFNMSKYLTQQQILYACNKFNLNDFIYVFRRLNYNRNESTFNDYENKIQIINFIFKIQKKEKITITSFPYGNVVDSLRFMSELYEYEKNTQIKELLKCHNISQLNELHDNLLAKVTLKQNKDINEKIREFCEKYKKINTNIIENVSFKMIDNVEDLIEEGSYMKHCVGGYASGLARGEHLIFSVKDLDTEERATLEFYKLNNDNNLFDTNDVTWVFNQLKSKYNKKASENIINKFKIFYKKLEKSGLKIKVDDNSHDLLAEERKDLISENGEIFINVINDDNLLPF